MIYTKNKKITATGKAILKKRDEKKPTMQEIIKLLEKENEKLIQKIDELEQKLRKNDKNRAK